MRYNFKPDSAQWVRPGRLKVQGLQAEMRTDNVQAGEIIFVGKAEDSKPTECVLICDHNGRWRLERLHRGLRNMRAERSSAGGSTQIAGSAARNGPVAAAATSEPEAMATVDETDLFGGDDGEEEEAMLHPHEPPTDAAALRQASGPGSTQGRAGPVAGPGAAPILPPMQLQPTAGRDDAASESDSLDDSVSAISND